MEELKEPTLRAAPLRKTVCLKYTHHKESLIELFISSHAVLLSELLKKHTHTNTLTAVSTPAHITTGSTVFSHEILTGAAAVTNNSLLSHDIGIIPHLLRDAID